jgi:hypothetical protein
VRGGGRRMSRIRKASYLQAHGEQLQLQVSQEHAPPHWHAPAVFRVAPLRFFLWFLRFDFMVMDF